MPINPVSSSIEEIPWEVLQQIFATLPLQTVARCCNVSKIWSSLIRDASAPAYLRLGIKYMPKLLSLSASELIEFSRANSHLPLLFQKDGAFIRKFIMTEPQLMQRCTKEIHLRQLGCSAEC